MLYYLTEYLLASLLTIVFMTIMSEIAHYQKPTYSRLTISELTFFGAIWPMTLFIVVYESCINLYKLIKERL